MKSGSNNCDHFSENKLIKLAHLVQFKCELVLSVGLQKDGGAGFSAPSLATILVESCL